MQLLDHTGEIFSETAGAGGGGSGFGGDEIQVLIIGHLVQVVPVLQELPAQVLAHLLQGTEGLCGTDTATLWGRSLRPQREP